MKVPLSWLKEFVRFTMKPTALAERLTMAGIEVEKVIDYGVRFNGVVVGEIVHIRPHPNADKLRLAFVETVKHGKPIEVVCGAPNIAIGQKVAFAQVGAVLPNGMVMEQRSIRGVESNGMICAEDELGLGSNREGTIVLDPGLNVGTPFAKAIGMDDVVLECAIPANRGDLQSIRGIAREVAAITGGRVKATRPIRSGAHGPAGRFRATIAARALCPVYTLRVIEGVTVRSSPEWLATKLRLAGIRPVNVIVDSTNYVMLEYGQPIHAFDSNTIAGSTITVRSARSGEHLRTLDGVDRTLDPRMLVVADGERPIALAGVMGGAATEITQATTLILLESAVFDPVSVRVTSRRLGLQSEASHRFEKGIYRGLPAEASDAAAALIMKLCKGASMSRLAVTGSGMSVPKKIHVRPPLFEAVLGFPISPAKAKKILTNKGCTIRGTSSWTVTVPAWRSDIVIPEDLVDEVGRINGYETIPAELPAMQAVPKPLPELVQLKEDVRNLLSGFGFYETISHAYYGDTARTIVGGEHYEVENPIDTSQQYLRRSISPQLLGLLRGAIDSGKDARLFQLGRVFIPAKGVPIERQQPWRLAIGMAFKPQAGYCHGRKLTGMLDELFDALGIMAINNSGVFVHADPVTVKGRVIEWAEIDLATMRDNFAPLSYTSLPKYPAVFRDISLWVTASLPYQKVYDCIVRDGKPMLESVELFDVFEKAGKRSLAFHLVFRSSEHTLTEGEILANMKAISTSLKALGAELR